MECVKYTKTNERGETLRSKANCRMGQRKREETRRVK